MLSLATRQLAAVVLLAVSGSEGDFEDSGQAARTKESSIEESRVCVQSDRQPFCCNIP